MTHVLERTELPEYSPEGFIARGPVWPSKPWQMMLLSLSLVDMMFPIRCETYRGTVARLERQNLPKWWTRRHGKGVGPLGGTAMSSDRHALLWLEEQGDMLIGYGFNPVIGEIKVGDEVTVWVKPWSGNIRRLRNHTRPRAWWQF